MLFWALLVKIVAYGAFSRELRGIIRVVKLSYQVLSGWRGVTLLSTVEPVLVTPQ